MKELESVFRHNNLFDAFKQNEALLCWDEVIGERLGRYTRSEVVRDRVLVVRVSSATVAHELSLLKPQLLQQLNARLDAVRIRDIRFVQGSIPRSPQAIRLHHDETAAETAHQLFADLDDEALARRFERLVVSQKDREASLLAAGGRRCLRCGAVYRGDAKTCPGCRYDPIDGKNGRD
jgi:hypothetical protein